MNDLIYYPYFEFIDQEFVNFSLLFLDKLRPIIPSQVRSTLSNEFKYIMDETDLIFSELPNFQDAQRATREAIVDCEAILSNPEHYTKYLGKFNDSILRDSRNHILTIYKDKYTHEFEIFCIKNSLGNNNPQGIRVHPIIGKIFMTHLANTVARRKGIDFITDDNSFHNYTIFSSPSPKITKQIEATQILVDLEIPANLRNANTAQIIEFRNEPSTRELRESFSKCISKIVDDSYENEVKEGDFSDFNSFRGEISKAITLFFGATVPITVSATKILQSCHEKIMVDWSEIISGLASFSALTILAPSIIKSSRNKFRARKYLKETKKILA